jgi:hypothetical protein
LLETVYQYIKKAQYYTFERENYWTHVVVPLPRLAAAAIRVGVGHGASTRGAAVDVHQIAAPVLGLPVRLARK